MEKDPSTDAKSLIDFLRIVGQLKKLKRTGWVRSGVQLPESDSDHMHRAAICAMLIPSSLPDGTRIDRDRCIRMALTHDVCEAIAGDYTPECSITKEEKHIKERDAMEEIRRILGNNPVGDELMELWEEYERGETIESRYVKDIDKFEMILQADEYERDQDLKLDQFFDSTRDYFKTSLFQSLDTELRSQRLSRLENPPK
jgi:putative hydrolase of HD superfamily